MPKASEKIRLNTDGSFGRLTRIMNSVSRKKPTAMMGTIISRTFMVAFFRSTMTAASNTRRIVVTMGGTRNALAKAELTELLITWLMPHQQIRPEMANREAVRECPRVFPVFASTKW